MTVNGTAVPRVSSSGALALNVGANTITIEVTAQDTAFTQTYTVTVTRASGAQTPFQQWAAANGVSSDPEVLGANGIKNLLNFAFGVDPVTGGSGPLQYGGTFAGNGMIVATGQPITIFEPTTFGIDFRMLFVRRKDYLAAGLTYIPQFSGDMVANIWANGMVAPSVLADDGTLQIVSVPYPPFVGSKKARFSRLTVTLAP